MGTSEISDHQLMRESESLEQPGVGFHYEHNGNVYYEGSLEGVRRRCPFLGALTLEEAAEFLGVVVELPEQTEDLEPEVQHSVHS